MAEETDEYTMIKDKAKEFKALFDRMDGDELLYFLEPYVMMGPDGKTPMDDVINVTFNDALTFGTRAVAAMGAAQRQTVVEGRKMTGKQCTKIENFIDDMAFAIDDWLANSYGIVCLDAFINEQICIRGHIGGRSCLRAEDKKFIPDVIPLDTRFLVYNRGIKGLKWSAPNYTRSATAIKGEYGLDIKKEEAEVVDLWDARKETIFIDEKQHKKQNNPYGYPPFVIVKSATGSMLQSKGARPHDGESIYWANRGLLPELHRTASILQTLNVGSFAGALQFESGAGLKAQKPKKPPFGIKTVVPVEKGMGYKAMPINDIRNATRLFYAILYTRIQQGGLSAIDYGNLTFPLSAVAIARLTSSRDQIFLPRIQAKAIFYQQLFKMIISQYKALKMKVELGHEGAKTEYDPKELEGDYEIKFRFFIESKEQQIANLSEAAAAERFISRHSITRNILKVQDPDAEDERFSEEQAERADEALFLYNRASKFIAQEKDVQARICANRLMTVLRARQATPELPSAEMEKKLKPKGGGQMIPLLGGKGGEEIIPEVGSEEEELSKAARQEERIAEEGAEAKQGRV